MYSLNENEIRVIGGIVAAIVGAVIGAGLKSIFDNRVARRNQKLMIRQTTVQELARIEGLFYKYPELYKYFHVDRENVDFRKDDEVDFPKNDNDTTKNQAIAISHNYMKIFAILLLHQLEFSDMFGDWVDNTIRNRYSSSAILRKTLIDHFEEYTITGKKQIKLMIESVSDDERERLESKLRDRILKLEISIQSKNWKKERKTLFQKLKEIETSP